MKRNKPILIALLFILLLSSFVFAMEDTLNESRDTGMPAMKVVGSDVLCTAKVTYLGKSIDATLELYQGATLVASWHKTGNSLVTFSETENFTSGLSYTLTISGTANGVAFTPQSTTQTLW